MPEGAEQGLPARLHLLAELVPRGARVVVDIGADHGLLAHRVGAIAVERRPTCVGRADLPWVIADGLLPFRHVDVAIIAGMGARTILAILHAGPRPACAVLHADDEPEFLRVGLAAAGWRIDAEALAPGRRRLAELIRVYPGVELAKGLQLAYGPRLLEGDDPLLTRHLGAQARYQQQLSEKLALCAPDRAAEARRRLGFLRERLRGRDAPPT